MPDLSQGAAWMRGEIIPISQAMIPVTDWGLTRSDITYDVVHVWEGAFFRLDDYLDRFEQSIKGLRLEIDQSREDIKNILYDLLGASGLRQAYVSMVASRGTPSVAGSRDPRDCSNHFYAWAVPFVWVIKPEIAKRGAHLKIANCATRIGTDSVDPTIKNYHWGDMTRAMFEALDEGFDTALLLDTAGHLTEGPGFNIFMIKGDVVITPSAGMLEGITRRTVMEIAKALDMKVEVRRISKPEFLEADGVFTATTAGGPVPVSRVDDRTFSNDAPGKRTMEIIDTYWKWHSDPKLSTPIRYID